MKEAVLIAFGFDPAATSIAPLQQGLINHTWKLTTAGKEYILQKINQQVFTHPADIDHNISLLVHHIRLHAPGYTFPALLLATDGSTLLQAGNDEYYRCFSFIKNSVSKTIVQTAAQAYEAAFQFGLFTHTMAGVNAARLKITIPGFHDLSLRCRQFWQSLPLAGAARQQKAAALTEQLRHYHFIIDEYEQIKTDPQFRLRVTHHDTKISNVLFDLHDKAICVIDLDTVMPGYFISDVGDMMRTYLSPAGEEETDLSKIEVREDFYKAIVQGYYDAMKDELTAAETQHFFYAGAFLIYMQAIRFLTDYLQNDRYYSEKYPDHNLHRAANQLILLHRYYQKKETLQQFSPAG